MTEKLYLPALFPPVYMIQVYSYVIVNNHKIYPI